MFKKKSSLQCILIFFFTLTSSLTASESEWKDVTGNFLDQIKAKKTILTDIKNIENKLYLIGINKDGANGIVLASFGNDGKKLTEDVLNNKTGADDISLAATNKTIIIQAKNDKNFKLYNVKPGYWSSDLEEITGIYYVHEPHSIVGTMLPSEFWTCTNQGCFITGSKYSNDMLLNKYVPTIIGLEPKTIDATRVYWAIKNNKIKKLAFENNKPIQTIAEYSYSDENINEPFKDYTFKELIPYEDYAALAVGIVNKSGYKKEQIIHIMLNKFQKNFSIDEIDTLEHTKAIAVTTQPNTAVYALIKNGSSFSIKKLELKKNKKVHAITNTVVEPNVNPSVKANTPNSPTKNSEKKAPEQLAKPVEPEVPFSNDYIVKLERRLNSNSQAFAIKDKKYRIEIGQNTIMIKKKRKYLDEWLSGFIKSVPNDIVPLGIVETANGDRLVLKKDKCIWVNKGIIYNDDNIANILPEGACNLQSKLNINGTEIFIEKNIVHIKKDNKITRLHINSNEIKSNGFIMLEPLKNEFARFIIIQHGESPKVLVIQKKDTVPTSTNQNYNPSNTTTAEKPPIFSTPIGQGTKPAESNASWRKVANMFYHPKISAVNSWNAIKNYFMGIWGLTKVYGR